MRLTPRIPIKALPLIALAVLLSTGGVAFSAATRDVQPFLYTFRVTAITVTGTFTVGDASTTTRVHLTQPSGRVPMYWRGKRDGGIHNGVGATRVRFVGDASYTSPDARCNRNMSVTSAGANPLVLMVLTSARDRVVTRPTVYVRVGKFPLVTGYPTRRDGSCGEVAKDWWDVAKKVYPFALLNRSGYTMTVQNKEAFDDGEAIEWTVEMTVRRIAFRRVSCAEAGGC